MPSFNSLADVVNQILICVSRDWRAQVGSDSVSGGEAKDSCHLIFVRLGVRGENQVLDLLALMIWLDMAQDSRRRRFRFVQSFAVARVNRKMSSAKKRCERWTPVQKWRG